MTSQRAELRVVKHTFTEFTMFEVYDVRNYRLVRVFATFTEAKEFCAHSSWLDWAPAGSGAGNEVRSRQRGL